MILFEDTKISKSCFFLKTLLWRNGKIEKRHWIEPYISTYYGLKILKKALSYKKFKMDQKCHWLVLKKTNNGKSKNITLTTVQKHIRKCFYFLNLVFVKLYSKIYILSFWLKYVLYKCTYYRAAGSNLFELVQTVNVVSYSQRNCPPWEMEVNQRESRLLPNFHTWELMMFRRWHYRKDLDHNYH